ncbi:OmpA family protein [Aquimarina intermedia]|uniref:Outer membrane protein OmpA-like peptidoglycan-associated protein n=1 Tax=Aquimarina intermedia TaxID=350814 RepID=A0A5S5BTQ5_9FLAO|nr:OmpA family protein [Aquimarina intermedia]TYP70397.1 outer membrane protein OmpA-like peptidoglycan-associated protein [Aquimarina intermedia]
MFRILQITILLAAILISSAAQSQERDLRRAKKQYEKYEYIDAQKTYLQVVEKGYKSADLYKNLGNSYYFNSQFEEALQWYEALITTYPDDVEAEYYFRYAQTLKTAARYDESNQNMEKFSTLNADDQRAQLFSETPDYLKRIEFQSGRYDIKNVAINSPFSDFGAAFKDDTFVFSSSRDTSMIKKSIHQWNNESFLDLHKASYDKETGTLSKVSKFSGSLNTKFHESTAVFTKDGNTIYFTRNNYNNNTYGEDKEGTNRLKIYRAYKTAQGWSTPESLPFNDETYSVAHPSLNEDENLLYFSSDMPGGQGLSDLYVVSINEDGSFGTPENLGTPINTEGKETFPFISSENDLYFSSNGHLGLGGLDVFVISLNQEEGKKQEVVNIGKPVNSVRDDFCFNVNETNKAGFFSSNRLGGKGNDDIYSFIQLEDLKDFCETTLTGVITDKDTGELLPGAQVSILNTNNEVVYSVSVGEDATYSYIADCEQEFFVRAEMDAYVTTEELIRTPNETQNQQVSIALEQKVKSADIGDDLAKVLSLNPIYFDFDKAVIRSDAEVELARVIEVMNEYPQMQIEVRSHTDSRGYDRYNMKLSERRAKATIQYMIDKGIGADRLSSKGFGEENPVNDCKDNTKCTGKEHALNRRSEFIIMN